MGTRISYVGKRDFLCGFPMAYDASEHDGGPVLTLQQYIEFFHRVKKIRVQMSADYTWDYDVEGRPPASGSGSISADIDMTRQSSPEPFVFSDALRDSPGPTGDVTGAFSGGDSSNHAYIRPFSRAAFVSGDVKAAKDFFYAIVSGSWITYDEGVYDGFYPAVVFSPTGDTAITPNLTGMTTGNVAIPTKWEGGGVGDGLTVSYSNVAIALSVTEWFPYATKAGDPAWSTTTGAPANGGPGA